MAVLSLCAGCATDDFRFGGTEEVTFTTAFPGVDVTTRAEASADVSGAKKVMYALVYQGEEFVESKECTLSGNDGTVTLQLASGMEYNIVFWASYDGKTEYVAPDGTAAATPTTPYTINERTGELTVNYGAMEANDDTNDAFTATHHYICGGQNQATTGIQLFRPFAQLNFATDDLDAAVVKQAYGEDPVVYSQVDFQAYTTMDLVGQQITGTLDDTKFHTKRGLAKKTILELGAEKNPKLLHTLYVLAPKAGGTSNMVSDVVLNVYKQVEGGESMNTVSPGSVPLQANYRTNIYGALLTSQTDFTVEINPSFAGEDKNILLVTSATQAQSAFEAAKQAAKTSTDVEGPSLKFESVADMAGQKVVFDNTPAAGETAKNINITYDLKGKAAPVFEVKGPVTLDLYDNGVIVETPAAVARRAQTRTTEEVKPLLYAGQGGTINVHSGRYSTYASPCIVVDGGVAMMENGTLESNTVAVKVLNNGVFNQIGGTVSTIQGGTAIYADNATVNLTGGNIDAGSNFGGNYGACVDANNNAKVTLNGTRLSTFFKYYIAKSSTNAQVSIEGGACQVTLGYGQDLMPFVTASEGTITLKGGMYNFNPSTVDGGKYLAAGAVVEDNGGTWSIAKDPKFFEGTVNTCADFVDKVMNSSSGSVITLGRSIDFVLMPAPLNPRVEIKDGKNITIVIPTGVTLDFKPSIRWEGDTPTRPLIMANSNPEDMYMSSNQDGAINIRPNSTLTLKGGGTIRGYAQTVWNNGTLNVEGVNFECKTRYYNNDRGVLRIDGTLNFKSGSVTAYQTAINLNSGTVNFSGGKFKTINTEDGYTPYTVEVKGTSQFNMSGGIIESTCGGVKLSTHTLAKKCLFTGGCIYAESGDKIINSATSANAEFTGGKFSSRTGITPAAGCSWSAINEVVDGKTYTSQIVGGGAAAPRRRR